MKTVRKYSPAQPNHPRVHKITFMLNDEEHKAVKRYLAKYKIVNKSRWYRETNLNRKSNNLSLHSDKLLLKLLPAALEETLHLFGALCL